jgi:hypothetical protein
MGGGSGQLAAKSPGEATAIVAQNLGALMAGQPGKSEVA